MRPLLTSLLAVWLGVCGGAANAQSWQPPADSQRCPSKWGADDQRGSGNLMKPETVLRATKLIRTGEVIELGQVLSASMPFSNGRVFEQQLVVLGDLLQEEPLLVVPRHPYSLE